MGQCGLPIELAIIPYRKLSFASRFGFTVRDLMMLKAFEQNPRVARIDWFERPDLPHEAFRRLLSARSQMRRHVHSHVGLDFRVPSALLKGRTWSAHSMRSHDRLLTQFAQVDRAGSAILLDFHPFYIPPIQSLRGVVYWYDLIDNFTRHNRFSPEEIAAVRRKYDFVAAHADIVTAVSEQALQGFPNPHCLPNRLLRSSVRMPRGEPEYDLGFLGFITDKFDVSLVERLGRQGHRILICGHSYDPAVTRQIEAIPNVTYRGAFAAADVPELIGSFRIGMIPYLEGKRHDESPIKFFQYVCYGRGVIMSANFNKIENEFQKFIHYYNEDEEGNKLDLFINEWKGNWQGLSASLRQRAAALRELFWEDGIDDLLDKVCAAGDSMETAVTQERG